MTKITNNSRRREGFNTKDGKLVFLEVGQTLDIDLEEGGLETAKANPHLGIEGVERNFSPTLQDLNEGAREQLDGLRASLDTKDGALRERDQTIETLTKQIDTLNSELLTVSSERDSLQTSCGDLQSQLESLQGQLTELQNKANGVRTGLVAEHKGGGKWVIRDSEGNDLVTGLSTDDKDSWLALDDAGKSKYVDDVQKQQS